MIFKGGIFMIYNYKKLFNSHRAKETTVRRSANIDEYYIIINGNINNLSIVDDDK